MITLISNYIRKTAHLMVPAAFLITMSMVSCQDFFDVDSSHVINAEDATLDDAADTIYSMIGVLNKMQAIADRTVLLGEARGDLVNINENTSSDLRDVALFQVGDDNKYNSPRDYYAIINQCNIYIAKADTSKADSHGKKLFLNEYAAIKAIRAWTYLQLVTTYGKVPFVTTPILTKEESELDYPVKDINGVCEYFINEDGLQSLAANDEVTYPGYGDIKGVPSRLFYMPLYIILGDLNLWAGHYLEAAKCYYKYLDTRNGTQGYPLYYLYKTSWNGLGNAGYTDGWSASLTNESTNAYSEVISLIPMDSVKSEGYYSELRGIFNTANSDNFKVSLVPSQYLKDLSNNQINVYYDKTSDSWIRVFGNEENNKGDLRLVSCWSFVSNGISDNNGNMVDYQNISKFNTTNGNVHIYRRTLVYLRLAEALNRAGYPFFAYYLLSKGISNAYLKAFIAPYYKNDSTMLVNNFPFPDSRYYLYRPNVTVSNTYLSYATIGIHSRGSGWAGLVTGAGYDFPYDYTIPAGPDSVAQQKEYQMKAVEDMIVNEEALEFAFEGYRYYDLLRVALRRTDDPTFLKDKIEARGGTAVNVDLTNKSNWFLRYKDKLGY